VLGVDEMNVVDKMLGLLRAAPAAPGSIAHWVERNVPLLPLTPQPPRLIRGAREGLELGMLPHDIAEHQLDSIHTGRPRVVQLKVDAIRAHYIDGRIVSREGAPLDCALHCQPGLRRLEQAMGCPIFVDGEYSEEGGFNATIAAQKAGRGQGVFWAFDVVPLASWQTGAWEVPTVERLNWLRDHILQADSPFVGMLDFWLLDAAGTAAKARELWLEGYEGIVTKDPEAGYTRARSPAWRRLKQTLTFDCPIVDAAIKDGVLKRVIARGPAEIGPITLASGWSAEEAERIRVAFQMGYDLPPAEITFQLTTGTKRSVRGARFIRLREDKKETGR
jgi:hypothetical protein